MKDTWVNKLKVGDYVIVSRNYYSEDNVAVVTKVTKTQIHAGGQVFRKNTLRLQGSYRWATTIIEEPLPEKIAEIKERQRAKLLKAILINHIQNASYIQLVQINEFINGTDVCASE